MQHHSNSLRELIACSQRAIVAYAGRSRTIAEAFHGRDNNFNLLRMIAASSVLISHSWSLAFSDNTGEPFTSFTPFSLGQLAVTLFFGLSGFLIAKSFHSRRSTVEFVIARVFRLYPGLLLALVFCVFVIGPLCTAQPLSTYRRLSQTFALSQPAGTAAAAGPVPSDYPLEPNSGCSPLLAKDDRAL
jgi:peptidoglycan/LPS O-acetylase OafA/YrhL